MYHFFGLGAGLNVDFKSLNVCSFLNELDTYGIVVGAEAT
jgi:hypothetical protein